MLASHVPVGATNTPLRSSLPGKRVPCSFEVMVLKSFEVSQITSPRRATHPSLVCGQNCVGSRAKVLQSCCIRETEVEAHSCAPLGDAASTEELDEATVDRTEERQDRIRVRRSAAVVQLR